MRCRHTYCSSHEEIWEDFHCDLELTRLASFRQPVSKFLFVIYFVTMKILTRFQDVLSSYTNPYVSRQRTDEAVRLFGCQQVSLPLWCSIVRGASPWNLQSISLQLWWLPKVFPRYISMDRVKLMSTEGTCNRLAVWQGKYCTNQWHSSEFGNGSHVVF